MPVTKYFTVNGRMIGESTSGVRRDYITDGLGSVVGTIKESGEVENTYRYKPYGGLLAKTGSAADPKFLWRGSRKWRDTGRSYAESYFPKFTYSSLTGLSDMLVGIKYAFKQIQQNSNFPWWELGPWEILPRPVVIPGRVGNPPPRDPPYVNPGPPIYLPVLPPGGVSIPVRPPTDPPVSDCVGNLIKNLQKLSRRAELTVEERVRLAKCSLECAKKHGDSPGKFQDCVEKCALDIIGDDLAKHWKALAEFACCIHYGAIERRVDGGLRVIDPRDVRGRPESNPAACCNYLWCVCMLTESFAGPTVGGRSISRFGTKCENCGHQVRQSTDCECSEDPLPEKIFEPWRNWN